MGYYNVRRKGLLSAWEISAAQLTFRGLSDDEIVKAVWPDTDMTDKRAVTNRKARLKNLRRKPEFIEYYKTIINEFQIHAYGKALSKIVEQIDSSLPWLANKAANDVLTRANKAVLGDDENAVTVKIEGLPELGSPDMKDNEG